MNNQTNSLTGQDNMGASQATGLGSAKAPEPHSGLGPTGAIPCADQFWIDYEKLPPEDQMRCLTDIRFHGRAYIKDGKRVDPNHFYREMLDHIELQPPPHRG